MLTVAGTGSAGFVGAYLVDELLARGYLVVGVDNPLHGLAGEFSAALATW